MALYFVAWSLRSVLRLQQSGNIVLNNAIGVTGEVYIPIPPIKSGAGKISIIIQDRLSEINAVTDAERTLKTGEKVTVMKVESEGVLLVVPTALPNNNSPEGAIVTKSEGSL
jgi:membrane protein implicated in regulation of membrane protease activity